MRTFNNACSFGPQTLEEAKRLNWQRMDCLLKEKLKKELDRTKIIKWFEKQDSEWREYRRKTFNQQLNQRRC